MNIIFFAFESAMSPLLNSQGIPLLKRLNNKNVRFSLLTFEKWNVIIGHDKKKKFFEKEFSQNGISWIKIPRLNLPLLPVEICNFPLGFIFLALMVLVKRPKVVHCRAYFTTMIALFLSYLVKLNYIFDMRGLYPEERRCDGGWEINSIKYKVTKYLEKKAIIHSSHIVVLIKSFKEYIASLPYYSNDLSISTIPNCCDMQRFSFDLQKRDAVRKNKGFENRFVLFYSGFISKWHLSPDMVAFFTDLKSLIQNAFFLIVTYADEMEKIKLSEMLLASGASSHDFEITTASSAEMPEWYLAGDFAISFREPTIISRIGSPVKFAEYLACGLPVIANYGTGISDEIIQERKVGVLFELNDCDSRKKAVAKVHKMWSEDMMSLRIKCRKACEESLSLDLSVERYWNIYKSYLHDVFIE
jgi:glycosyltransferase involved in cell wall biosynthesis